MREIKKQKLAFFLRNNRIPTVLQLDRACGRSAKGGFCHHGKTKESPNRPFSARHSLLCRMEHLLRRRLPAHRSIRGWPGGVGSGHAVGNGL